MPNKSPKINSSFSNETLDTTKGVIHNLSNALNSGVRVVSKGTKNIVTHVGDLANNLGLEISNISQRLTKTAGNLSKKISNKMGKVIAEIPIIGGPTAYLVESATDGVYFVVVTVGDTVSAISRTGGKTLKKGAELVVITVGKSRAAIKEVQTDTVELIEGTLTRTKQLGINLSKKFRKLRKSMTVRRRTNSRRNTKRPRRGRR